LTFLIYFVIINLSKERERKENKKMKTNLKDLTLTAICPICGAETEIAVSFTDYLEWMEGELVQNAFPYLSAEERESLVSGICPSCWDKMF
jgi:ssDNA-binding Zn-finger/Zn-ribbon topoisomerase 1